MPPDRSIQGGTTAVDAVGAAPLAAGSELNTIVTVGTTDVPINVPTGTWNYLKVIVETADRYVAVAVNEAAVLGTAGTPPDPVWGAGDLILGTSTEFQPLVPALTAADDLHLIASAGSTVVRLVLRK